MTSLLRKIFFSVLLFGFFLPLVELYAEESLSGITISPAFQEVVLDQADITQDLSVSVSNSTEAPMTFRVSALDFGSLDESGGVAFLGASNDLSEEYSLASWMRLENDVLIIAPGATETFLVTIENGTALAPGGHYGAITFKTENALPGTSASDAVSITQLFSSLVFVKKVGGEVYGLALQDPEYTGNFLQFEDRLRLRFENSGNIHVVPRGRVEVVDPLGRLIAKGIINQESALTLPESRRVYPVRLEMLARAFMPGRYTMTVAYRYDGREEFTDTSLQFLFIPLPALMGLFLFITIFWWYTIKGRNGYLKKWLKSVIFFVQNRKSAQSNRK